MRPSFLTPLASAIVPCLAAVHYMYVGAFDGSTYVGLEFDDSTSALTLVHNHTLQTTAGSIWSTIDSQRKNIYVATGSMYQSYAINPDKTLRWQKNISLPSGCGYVNHITASPASPLTVFGAGMSTGCPGQAISVTSTGQLDAVVGNMTYNDGAGVHGLAVAPGGEHIYSADDLGNAVWAHRYRSATGAVEEVQYIQAPKGAGPRHLTVHPNGKWVYVVYEKTDELAVFRRDEATGLLVDPSKTYSLLPAGYTNTSSYWADEVLISGNASTTSPKYIVTGTRSRADPSLPGFVSAFGLDAETGAIASQLFTLPTTASGGKANAVSPAPWDESLFAITDSGAKFRPFVEVWRIAEGGMTAAPVAHLDMEISPANAVWYS